MSNKNNDFKFNIPLGAVIVSWFIAPPLGLVLTVLYVASEINKNKETSGGFSAEKARAEFEDKINKIKTETSTKKKGKKMKIFVMKLSYRFNSCPLSIKDMSKS